MAGCISALAVILVVVLVVTYMNSPIRRFDAALNSDDATTAQSLYATNASNEKFASKAQVAVEEYIQKSTDAYCNDEIEYKVAKQRISDLSWCPDADEVQKDALETINNVRTSRDKYTKAEWALSKEDYLSALTNFKEVVEDDKKDYASAQQKISKTSEAWCQSAINAANSALAENNAVQAYIALNEVNAEYRNDQLREMLKDTTVKAQESVAAQLQGKINSGAFKDAYLAVTSIPKEIVNDKITNLKAEISNGLLGQAETKASEKNYKAAISLLTDDKGNVIDAEFKTTVSDYQKKQDEQDLASLKGYFKVKYDSIDKEYDITPHYMAIARNRNMVQEIVIKDGTAYFLVLFGFISDNWIFMDRITIDCDGTQFNLSVDYSNRRTQVGYGEISEVTSFMDAPLLQLLGNDNRLINLEPIISAMNSATKVTVRFSGKGHKDVTIPTSQIEELNGFWIAYNILKDNPDLVSVIE